MVKCVTTTVAARYEYKAIEFKVMSHGADGVFLPREAGLPLYFLEDVTKSIAASSRMR